MKLTGQNAYLFETESIAPGVAIVNELTTQKGVSLVDMFPLYDGRFFALLASEKDDLKCSKTRLFRPETSAESLVDVLYHLNEYEVAEAIGVFQSASMLQLSLKIDRALQSGVAVIEVRKPRTAMGYLYLTGSASSLQKIPDIEVTQLSSQDCKQYFS